ncbi:MAG: hypothetical protein JEY97_16375 [Bacteroidales bacterium]|nr:hypothetical protein [Bacteroidales bacterium]
MKKIHLTILFLLFGVFNISAQFYISTPPGYQELDPYTEVELEIIVTHTDAFEAGAYEVDLESLESEASWITEVTPSTFTLNGFDAKGSFKLGGICPHLTEGFQNFSVTVLNHNGITNSCVVVFYVTKYYGIEDYISCSYPITFSEQTELSITAEFHDEYPYSPLIGWNLNIKLFTTQGEEYDYVDINSSNTNNTNIWEFVTPDLPENLLFQRNSEGQIMGILTVSALEQYYANTTNYLIGILKEPDQPTVYLNPTGGSTIELLYTNTGGTNYLIYYDIDPGPPYNGTGLTQGDSPIEVGNLTSFQLDGVQECTQYYIAVKASNDQGTSDYSIEKQISVFEVPNSLPIYYHFEDYNLVEDYTFENNHYFIGNTVIQSGATVIMNGGYIYFEEDSKVIIEPGGKLIINGTTLTSPCDQYWQGIQVWGISSEHQYPDANGDYLQGYLELNNGAIIENAITAVDLYNPEGNNSTGGIVYANDAIFRNNARSIHALNYSNFDPQYPEIEKDYFSNFKDCTFEITLDYLGDETFYKHVDLASVKGIRFVACDFSSVLVTGVSQYSAGIAAYSAGFSVFASCTTNDIPCSEYKKCTFSGFYNAIYAGSTNSNTFNVNRAIFENNTYGIRLVGVNNPIVLSSEFHIGANEADGDECEGKGLLAAGCGISLTNSIGFAIEENKFYKATGAPPGNYIGVKLSSCPSENDVIYRNEFNGISVGIQAEGINRSGNDETGITYCCNQNDDNNYDFYVADNSIVGSYMGWYDNPSGNTLSSNAQV